MTAKEFKERIDNLRDHYLTGGEDSFANCGVSFFISEAENLFEDYATEERERYKEEPK